MRSATERRCRPNKHGTNVSQAAATGTLSRLTARPRAVELRGGGLRRRRRRGSSLRGKLLLGGCRHALNMDEMRDLFDKAPDARPVRVPPRLTQLLQPENLNDLALTLRPPNGASHKGNGETRPEQLLTQNDGDGHRFVPVADRPDRGAQPSSCLERGAADSPPVRAPRALAPLSVSDLN